MPERNSIKQYISNGTYHVYNRGNDKQTIFNDDEDYRYFLHLLAAYLTKPNHFQEIKTRSFYKKIKLHAYCLMPNHFHLLLTQKRRMDMAKFIKCLSTRYTLYVNKKYKKTGHLYQGRYKARLITSDADFMNTSKYIHRNPTDIPAKLESYQYSSLGTYLSKHRTHSFLYHKDIYKYFNNNTHEYKAYIFLEDQILERTDLL